MLDNRIGKRYADAIFLVAESNNNLKNVYQALNNLMELYTENQDFKMFISHPLISKDDKKGFLKKIYSNLEENILNIILYLLDKNRIDNIKEITIEYLKIYYAKNRILDVEGIFSREITEEQKNKLIENLEKRTNKNINLTTKIDKTIIGGGILKIGDKIIDGSIRTQLDKLINKN